MKEEEQEYVERGIAIAEESAISSEIDRYDAQCTT
jgi:hypothetical protein